MVVRFDDRDHDHHVNEMMLDLYLCISWLV